MRECVPAHSLILLLLLFCTAYKLLNLTSKYPDYTLQWSGPKRKILLC